MRVLVPPARMSGPRHPRGTSNTNDRGSSYTRAARRVWLVLHWGDGTTAPCFFCGRELTSTTVTVDRVIPGIDGGRYVHGNIRPACLSCNSVDGNDIRRGRRHHSTVPHVARTGRLLPGQLVTIHHLHDVWRLTFAAIAREVGCTPATAARIIRSREEHHDPHPTGRVRGPASRARRTGSRVA